MTLLEFNFLTSISLYLSKIPKLCDMLYAMKLNFHLQEKASLYPAKFAFHVFRLPILFQGLHPQLLFTIYFLF